MKLWLARAFVGKVLTIIAWSYNKTYSINPLGRGLNFTEKAFYLGLGFALITILILIIGLRRINYLNRSLRTKNSLIEEQNLALTSQTDHLQESIRENQNLVSLMVHDLKNPLAQVGSLAQLPIDDEVKDLIGRASQNGLDLIYDIMEVTHAESGELKLDKQVYL